MKRRTFFQSILFFFGLVSRWDRTKSDSKDSNNPCLSGRDEVLIKIKGIYSQGYLRIVFNFKPRHELACSHLHKFLVVRRGILIGYLSASSLKPNDQIWVNVGLMMADGSLYWEN